VNQIDVERIAQATLRELGVAGAVVTVTPDARPGEWRVDIQGHRTGAVARVRCGQIDRSVGASADLRSVPPSDASL
jgi:hypothetical protein